MITAQELVAKVKNLPPVPHAALKLVSLLDQPAVSNTEIVQALRCDNVLTAKLLRACNSPYFGLDDPVSSVDQAVLMLGQRMTAMEQNVAEIKSVVLAQRIEKEWYTTSELAEALGRSQYTIQERWANDGRIECQKDPNTGKWRIPGPEYRRLVGGGALKPKRR